MPAATTLDWFGEAGFGDIPHDSGSAEDWFGEGGWQDMGENVAATGGHVEISYTHRRSHRTHGRSR